MVPTDKSGRLAVMTLETYIKAGAKHTSQDEEIDFRKIKEVQSDLNGHTSMIIKIFKICKAWNQTDRVRETMINHSFAICPLY